MLSVCFLSLLCCQLKFKLANSCLCSRALHSSSEIWFEWQITPPESLSMLNMQLVLLSNDNFPLCYRRICELHSQSSFVLHRMPVWQLGVEQRWDGRTHCLCGCGKHCWFQGPFVESKSSVVMRKLFQRKRSFFEVHWHFQTAYSFICWSLCLISPCKGMMARLTIITSYIASLLISQTKWCCKYSEEDCCVLHFYCRYCVIVMYT